MKDIFALDWGLKGSPGVPRLMGSTAQGRFG